jgi:hypothetical protein
MQGCPLSLAETSVVVSDGVQGLAHRRHIEVYCRAHSWSTVRTTMAEGVPTAALVDAEESWLRMGVDPLR